MAALARDMVIANTFGSAALMIIFLLGVFIIPKGRLQPQPLNKRQILRQFCC